MWRQVRHRSRIGEAQRNSTSKIEKPVRGTSLGTRNSAPQMSKTENNMN